jgi:hypothetical protein
VGTANDNHLFGLLVSEFEPAKQTTTIKDGNLVPVTVQHQI